MSKNGTKVNTLIDSTKLQAIDNWLGATPKQGNVPVQDVEEYLTSEATAKQLDPPGSAKAVAKAARKAHAMAVGVATSGLTLEALCRLVSPLCPRDQKGNPTSEMQVERVLRGLLKLHTTLEPGGGE